VSGIRAIIFDLDNTLWDVWPVIVRAEHAMHDFLARHYPRVTARHDLRSMRNVRARMAIEHPAMQHDFTWLRLEALRCHAREVEYPESMAEQAFEAFYGARNDVTLYDDVRPALERLASRVPVVRSQQRQRRPGAVRNRPVLRGRARRPRRRHAQARSADLRDPARARRARGARSRSRRR
jgi:beta-phosphoglucomutase-like phosphatase (HAD superfamily)